MPETIIAQAARLDVFEICEYLEMESGSAELSDRFGSAALATFQKLAKFPGLGRPRNFKKSAGVDLRSWRVDGFPNYLIFYKPFRSGVEIVRVLHGARDLGAQFDQ